MQVLPLPLSPVEWLPENGLVFVLLDLASDLVLSTIHAGSGGDGLWGEGSVWREGPLGGRSLTGVNRKPAARHR